MPLACCFDCGCSERDRPCMPDSVHCKVDFPRRHFPLSAVSVNDCSATLRACKLSPVKCAPPCVCASRALCWPRQPELAVLWCARHCHGFRCYAACVASSGIGLIFKYAEACQLASALLILLFGDVDSGLKCVCFSFSRLLRCLILSCKTNVLPASVKVEAHTCQ